MKRVVRKELLRVVVGVLAGSALVAVVALAAIASPKLARTASRGEYTPPAKGGGGGGGGAGNPNLGVTIGGSSGSVAPGGTVAFTVTVKNTGAQTGSNVILTIQLGSAMQLQGPPAFDRGSGCVGTTQLTCNLDFLPVGITTQVLFSVTVSGNADQAVQVSVTSAGTDQNLADNSAAFAVHVGTTTSTSTAGTPTTGGKKASPSKCVVPLVLGESITKAKKAIAAAGCSVGKITDHSFFHLPKASINTVTTQTPAAGSKLKKHGAVKLTVAVASMTGTTSAASTVPAGVTSCTVPAVVGVALATAWNAILKADCTVKSITYAHSSKLKTGLVSAVLPAAGSHLGSRGKVKLVVAKK